MSTMAMGFVMLSSDLSRVGLVGARNVGILQGVLDEKKMRQNEAARGE